MAFSYSPRVPALAYWALAASLAAVSIRGAATVLPFQGEPAVTASVDPFDFESDDWVAPSAGPAGPSAAAGVVFLDSYPGAVCLDGSPGAYYFRPGRLDKWMIYFEGGGWCQSPEFCLQRSPSHLGSSKSYPETVAMGGEYFSPDPVENPIFHDWSLAYLKYCDGGSFSGLADQPLVVKGKPLYFRGGRILEAVLDDLMKRGLAGAAEVVISGGSAGGLATYLHADRVRDLVLGSSPGARVTAMPHSGFFPDYELQGASAGTQRGHFHSGQRWVFEAMNSTGAVNAACVKANAPAGEAWRCFFAEHTAPFIATPVFALQSVYDSWASGNEFGASKGDVSVIRKQGELVGSLVQRLLLDVNPSNGAFLDSCSHHMGGWESIVIDGASMKEAFTAWYMDPTGRRAWIQDRLYPCPECCIPAASAMVAQE